MSTNEHEPGGIHAGRIEADNVVSGVQIQGGDAKLPLPCAGYVGHPFVENDGCCERMSHVACTPNYEQHNHWPPEKPLSRREASLGGWKFAWSARRFWAWRGFKTG